MKLTLALSRLPRLRWLPWLVILVGFGSTFVAWHVAQSDEEQARRAMLDFRVGEILGNIKSRLKSYEQVLHGAVGLFAASESISRDEFRAYIAAQQLEKNFPGIQGIGFSQLVHPKDKSSHIQKVRSMGFHGYIPYPDGVRAIYTSIIYLEPFDWRNQRAFGYDMYSEPVRRVAMSRAWDEGVAAISGKVKLRQETDQGVQAGFLMYLPVYHNHKSSATQADRRANLQGWAYSPFRMNDLMKGVLGKEFGEVNAMLDLEIYDSAVALPEHLMYDSDPGNGYRAYPRATLEATRHIEVAGRTWTVVAHTLPAFRQHSSGMLMQRFIVITGITGTLLLASIIWLLVSGRARALGLAMKMNSDLLESKRYQMALLANLPAAVVVHGPDTAIRYCNAEALHLLGLAEEQALGRSSLDSGWKFLSEDGSTMPPEEYPVNRVLSEKAPLHGCVLGIASWEEQGERWVLANAFPHLDSEGRVSQVVVSFLDITPLRLAEKMLSDAVAEQNDLYEHAPVGYHSLNEEGMIVRINQTELDWLGYTREEVIGKVKYTDLLTPASQAVFHENYPRFMERGFVRDLDYELVRKDGSIFMGLLSATAIYDENGRFRMSRSTLYDISARKRVEKALLQTRAKLQQIVDVSPAATYVVQLDPDGVRPPRVAFHSRNIVQMVGYSLEDWGQPGFWEAHIHPEDRQQALAVQATLFERETLQHEYRFMHEDGSIVWVDDRLVLVRDELGRPSEIVGTWLDITDRVNNERGLLRLNRFYSVLSQTNEAIVHIRDETRLFEEVCRIAVEVGGFVMAWMGMLDEDGGEVIPVAHWGRNEGYLRFLMDKGVFRHDGPTAKAIALNNSVVNNDTVNNPIMAPWREEALKRGYYSSAAFPVSRAGKPVGALGLYAADPASFTPEINELFGELVADVSFALDFIDQESRRSQAELKLQQLNEELEQRVVERTRMLESANRELEAFSYSVSHDLRAPLRSIDGFSQILVRKYDGQLDETGRDYLQRVQRASQRMGELIDDLLMLSRVSRAELKRENVDFSQIAREVEGELQARYPTRQVEVRIQDGMTAHADGRLIRVVLENLLGNAWKFTAHSEKPYVEFGCGEQGGARVFYVRDNGAGFDMQYASKLFGAFQRLHKAEEFEGTGVGLATVLRIINRHDGAVWAEAEVGKGATFFFSL